MKIDLFKINHETARKKLANTGYDPYEWDMHGVYYEIIKQAKTGKRTELEQISGDCFRHAIVQYTKFQEQLKIGQSLELIAQWYSLEQRLIDTTYLLSNTKRK